MFLTHLQLSNFKTYAQLDADFGPKLNCIVGNNGVGKTNLLDAIYHLSFCKSSTPLTDIQNIRTGEEHFAIHGQYQTQDGQDDADKVTVSCIQRRGQPKQMRWNKKPYRTLGEHIGRIPLVMISPDDQQLIQGGSEARRKFIDGVISQTDPHYLTHLLQYHKALNQRNRLLKQFYDDRRWDQPAIALWDQQLALHGTPLYQSRHDFLKAYLPLFQQYHTSITDGAEEVEIRWESHADIPLQQQLEQAYRADRSAQYTTVGPHKDDLILLVGGLPAKKIASQGQQKTLVVALKLAQSDYLRQRCGTPPILLLDDIFDKLDLTRVTQLMQIVGSTPFGQTFVTDTQPGRVQHILTQIPPMQHNTYIATPGTLTLTDNTSHV